MIPNEEKAVVAALAAAIPQAAAGKYVDACNTLRPVIAEWDSVIVASKNFYGGYYAKLDTIRLYDAYEGCEMVYSFADAAIALADAILESKDASCKLFPGLNNQLHSYANYAAALRDAENEMKNKEVDYAQKNIDFLMTQVIEPQVADLTGSLCTTTDCDAATEVLKKATVMLKNSVVENGDAEEGDVTDLITNPTCDVEDGDANKVTGWTWIQGNGDKATHDNESYDVNATNVRFLNSWAGGGLNSTFYQELPGVPDGTYRLVVAARANGDNAWIFAATTSDVKDASTKFVEVKNYDNKRGEIWAEDSLAWEAAGKPETDVAMNYPYYMANGGVGYGWSWHVIEDIKVTNRYLCIGFSANADFTGKEGFTGSWMSADDWSLELVEKSEEQGEYNPFLGVDNVEVATPVVQGIFDLFGRRIDTPTAPGIYIVNGKKMVVK